MTKGRIFAPTVKLPKRKTIGTIIGQFKSTVTKQINKLQNCPNCPVWQRNYYERIIRNEKSLNNIREYIINNPANWISDKYNIYSKNNFNPKL